MSNYIHLIAGSRSENNLSDILRDLKKYTSGKIIQSIKEEPARRRNGMLLIFSQSDKKNFNNTNYQFWQQNNPCRRVIL